MTEAVRPRPVQRSLPIERGVAEWSYQFTAADGAVTAIRGCDVFEFEGDLIRRKDAFRKVYLANSMACSHQWRSNSGRNSAEIRLMQQKSPH